MNLSMNYETGKEYSSNQGSQSIQKDLYNPIKIKKVFFNQ